MYYFGTSKKPFFFRFKKRMKQSFEDEESFEDGQYPTSSSEQVRSLLMGMSENMGKMWTVCSATNVVLYTFFSSHIFLTCLISCFERPLFVIFIPVCRANTRSCKSGRKCPVMNEINELEWKSDGFLFSCYLNMLFFLMTWIVLTK